MVETSDPRRRAYEQLKAVVADGGTAAESEVVLLDAKGDASLRGPHGNRVAGDARSEKVANDVADAAACFANSDGGLIVLGLEDRVSGPDAWTGTVADATWLAGRVRERIAHSVAVEETTEPVDGRDVRVLLVFVTMSEVPVADTHGRYRHREGASCKDIPPQQLGSFSVSRSSSDWSARASASMPADALGAIGQLQQWLRSTKDPTRMRLASKPPDEMLNALGLVHETGSLTVAGELLCVYVPRRGPLMDLIVRPTIGAPTRLRIDPTGEPLAAVFPQVELAVRSNLSADTIHAGLVLEQVLAIPEEVVREALVNAVMHRDWAIQYPISVVLEGDLLTVESPGRFLPGISETTLLTAPSRTRNQTLARTIRSLRLAEGEGSGINMMFSDMLRLGQEPPSICETPAGTTVKLTVQGGPPDPAVISALALLPAAVLEDIDQLLIFSVLWKQHSVSATELAAVIQKNRFAATASLRRAAESGVVVETSRDGRYRLADPLRTELASRLTYLRRSTKQWAGLLDELLNANGAVRARDLVELFDIKQVHASRVLREAVARQQIEKAPGREMGSSVHYLRAAGPGAAR